MHGANNGFKVWLLGRQARRSVVIAFGVPAMLAAIAGALLLNVLAGDRTTISWEMFGREAHVTPVKIVLGV